MLYKIIPTYKVYSSKDSDYKIYKVKMEDEFGEFNNNETIIGDMIDLSLDIVYEIEAEIEYNNFGKQYRVKNVFKADYSEEEEMILFIELFGKRFYDKIKCITTHPITSILNSNLTHKDIGISENDFNNIKSKIESNRLYMELIGKFKEIDISFKLAKKIIDQYGHKSIDIIKKNPYILYTTVSGIGFKKADQIAMNLGLSVNSEQRIISAIIYILKQNVIKGNTWIYINYLYDEIESLLGFEVDIDKYIYRDIFFVNDNKISLTKIVSVERSIVRKLDLINEQIVTKIFDKDYLSMLIGDFLNETQSEFVHAVNENNLVILCGYAGTGKTISLKVLLNCLESKFLDVVLVSPTAKAAKVLSISTERKASTIHRLLGWDGKKFFYNSSNKLTCDLLIIDEMSMVDMFIFDSLLKAIDNDCRVVMVGDVAQLEPVQCGNVFYDLIKVKKYKTIEYTEIYRQKENSGIILLSKMIRTNNSDYINSLLNSPNIKTIDGVKTGFIKIGLDANIILTTKEDMLKKVLCVYRSAIGKSDDILLMSPFKKNELGTHVLNRNIKHMHNNIDGIVVDGCIISVSDLVRHTKNEYDKPLYDLTGKKTNKTGVFNGDYGYVYDIRGNDIIVNYDGFLTVYKKPYNNLELAYAMTVHSSQGSQADIVIGVVDYSHRALLSTSLLYTLITRARKSLVLIIDCKSFKALASKNNNTIVKNNTYIQDFLKGKITLHSKKSMV